ncbi:MAG: hypothetical protein MSA01_02335 [Anaeromassilibacillus sp.]|nr:hypothetical protein [Anaeromassilibacillus sp.]MDY3778930.1 hypothetical protein [Candidatus Limousia pullorum]
MLEYINSKLTGTGGGTQTPILTLYRTYLEKVYTFKHESGAIENYFYEYMSGIQAKATILYTAYCNYKQGENSDESAAYGKKCESFLTQANEYLKAQKAIVTKEEDYKHIVNTVTKGNRTYPEYRLISNLNGKTIYFSDFIVDDSFLLREKMSLWERSGQVMITSLSTKPTMRKYPL